MTARRETIQAKAHRLLTTGRVSIVLVLGEQVEARVQGDSALYRVGFHRPRWTCTCPYAQRGRRGTCCAHVLAVQLVCPTARQQRQAREA